jgi:hypothetical protein
MAPFDLKDSHWESLLRGLARGEYQLLLGAGASVDSVDSTGNPLPGGQALSDELIAEFRIPVSGQAIGLARAYEAAARRSHPDGRSIHRYLADRFTGCAPAQWYADLTQMRWHRLWTLNIDDVLERAYDEAAAAPRSPIPLSWNKPYYEPDRSRNEVVAVHLHGRAIDGLMGESQLVFSIIEYLDVVQSGHAWHTILGDELASKPFLIIGARMAEEYDLAEILRRGNQAMEIVGQPSVVVLRSLDELAREEFRAWGFLSVEADAATFFHEVANALPDFLAEERLALAVDEDVVPPEAFSFLQQFKKLGVGVDTPDPHHDFYAGHDPAWADILADRDAIFPAARATVKSVLTNDPSVDRIVCIHGPRFCGKSTALLRAGRILLSRGWNVYLFRGEVGLDVRSIVWWIMRSPQSVFLFDGLADEIRRLALVLEQLSPGGHRLRVIGSEREQRMQHIRSVLPLHVIVDDQSVTLGALEEPEVDALLEKLRTVGRLGRLTGLTHEEQKAYFHRHDFELFGSLADLEGGSGFRGRLHDQFSTLREETLRHAYLVAAMAASVGGYGLPASVVAASAGIPTRDVLRATSISGPLAEMLRRERDIVHPRQRTLAAIVLNDLAKRDIRFKLSLALARALSPYVSIDAIRKGTVHYRVVRQVMDHQVLAAWIGREQVESWYRKNEPYYSWNARYWEQRALSQVQTGHFDKAESYAANAVERHRDAFTLNTLGTVLVRKALQWFEAGSPESLSCFWRGVRCLRDSKRMAKLRGLEFEHPYITFFSYAIAYARAVDGARRDDALKHEWDAWREDALRSRAFQHPVSRRQLQTFQTRWSELDAA